MAKIVLAVNEVEDWSIFFGQLGSDAICWREITINKLPDCWAKEQLQKMVQDPKIATVIVAATGGVEGKYAAFVGWPKPNMWNRDFMTALDEIHYHMTNAQSPERVARMGDKIEHYVAAELFPELEALAKGYRY